MPAVVTRAAPDSPIPVLWIVPEPLRDAWIADPEYTEIALYPNGWTSMDACGCCFTDHAPGWYLGKVRRTIAGPCISWTPICAPDGGPIAPPHYFDLLDAD
jgi:hypothetical protein